MVKTWVGWGCAWIVACGGDGNGDEGPSEESSTTAPTATDSSSTEPASTESSSPESSSTSPGTTESSSTEAGSSESSTGDTDSDPACVPPAVIVGCEDIEPPVEDVAGARGILVEADRAVLTFSNVNDPAILCDEAELETCNCESWGFATRFTIEGELQPGVVPARSVSVRSAAGDCEFTAGDSGTVVELEIIAMTETCVAGHAQIQDEYTHLSDEFTFVAPRC